MTKETQFRSDSHYVPNVYLRQFTGADGRISTYQLLVSHAKVPLWKSHSVRGVAYRAHLYTRIAAGRETDEIERWLDRDFEAPAAEALRKATADEPLRPLDWNHLARFVAAQDVRTPARLLQNLQRWEMTVPKLLQETMEEAVRKLEAAKRSGARLQQRNLPDYDYIPIRVTKQMGDDQNSGTLKGEIIAGRSLWLYSMRHLLTRTANILQEHKWTILRPAEGLTWFTSDDPVTRLNHYGNGKYDFSGGWGNPGTEILLVLGPRHLLCTQVGKQPPRRGMTLSLAGTGLMRRFMAEHAHRTIFAAEPDVEVPSLRPRVVDSRQLRDENEQWRRWHAEQSAAERTFTGSEV